MTYRELLALLNSPYLPSERLDDDVTICTDNEEYFVATSLETADANHGVLDVGHVYLAIDMSDDHEENPDDDDWDESAFDEADGKRLGL